MLKIFPFAKSFKFQLHFKPKAASHQTWLWCEIMWKNKMYPYILIMLLSMVLKPHLISCCCQETVPLDTSEQNRQLSDREIFCWADLPIHFKANTREHLVSSACCATLSPFIYTRFLVQWFCIEFRYCCNTKYAFLCVCLCLQGHKQSSRTEAGCWNIDHISQTYWKYCVDLLRVLHCLWHSRSSGTHILLVSTFLNKCSSFLFMK